MGFKQKVKDIYSGYLNYLNAKNLPRYIEEQVLYRMELCEDCANAPICPHCKCISPVLFFSSTKTCKLEKWGPMVTEDEWTKFKLTPEYNTKTNKPINDEINRSSVPRHGDEGDTRSDEQS